MADNLGFSEHSATGHSESAEPHSESQCSTVYSVTTLSHDAPPPPYQATGCKLDDKPPPYREGDGFNQSQIQVVTTTGFPQPPPSYPGFPDHHSIIMQQPGMAACQHRHGDNRTTVIVAEPTYPPPNHMCLSCIVLWFCCLPVGLIAMYFSCVVQDRHSRGYHQGAANASYCARTLGNIGFFIGLFFWTFVLIWLFI